MTLYRPSSDLQRAAELQERNNRRLIEWRYKLSLLVPVHFGVIIRRSFDQVNYASRELQN